MRVGRCLRIRGAFDWPGSRRRGSAGQSVASVLADASGHWRLGVTIASAVGFPAADGVFLVFYPAREVSGSLPIEAPRDEQRVSRSAFAAVGQGSGKRRTAEELMIRLASVLLVLLLAGCATPHGPRSFVLSASDIERQIETDLGSAFELFKGLDARRPQVALMPISERLQLTWTVRVPDGPTSVPLGVAVALAGKPVLNAARSGINLTDVTLEDVRLTGVPKLFSFGLAQLGDRKGAKLPDLPLVSLPSDQLMRQQVSYGATGVEVTFGGLRVDIAPK